MIRIVPVVFILALVACGGSSSPTAATPTVTAISIIGFSRVSSTMTWDYPYTVIATYSNTTIETPTTGITWSSSNTQIATINASTGVLTNVAGRIGSTTITATYRGTSATMIVNAI